MLIAAQGIGQIEFSFSDPFASQCIALKTTCLLGFAFYRKLPPRHAQLMSGIALLFVCTYVCQEFEDLFFYHYACETQAPEVASSRSPEESQALKRTRHDGFASSAAHPPRCLSRRHAPQASSNRTHLTSSTSSMARRLRPLQLASSAAHPPRCLSRRRPI